LARLIMSPVNAVRSVITISSSVRRATTPLMPSFTVSPRRADAKASTPLEARKYCAASCTRHFT
jgi:hypothetical protein